MYLPIAIFFLVGTLALLAVTVSSDRPPFHTVSGASVVGCRQPRVNVYVGGGRRVPAAA